MTPRPTHQVLPACSRTVRLIRLKKLVIAISRVIAPQLLLTEVVGGGVPDLVGYARRAVLEPGPAPTR